MARTPPGYYLHLIAWAQIGVLIRVYLAELFGSACPSVRWAPCLTSSGSRWGGAFFTDLPANILGSFLMGLFVSSDVLSNSLKHNLTVEAPFAMLPVKSPLQEHLAFQVGLRTGLCGSLTTFASWLTQMVLMIVGGHNPAVLPHTQWVEALGGLLVGTLAASASLVVGQHCALLVYHRLNPGAFIPFGSPAPEQNKLEEPSSRGLDEQQQQLRQGSHLSDVSKGDWAGGGSISSQRNGEGLRLRTVSSSKQGLTTVVVVQHEGPSAAAAAAAAVMGYQQGGGQRLHSLSSFSHRQDPGAVELAAMQHSRTGSGYSIQQQQLQPPSPPRQQRHDGVLQGFPEDAAAAAAVGTASAGSVTAAGHKASSAITAPLNATNSSSYPNAVVYEVDEGEEAAALGAQQVIVDGFAVLSIVLLTGISLWRVIQGSTTSLEGKDDPFSQHWFWWAILFGPLGCYGRYYLSRYNGKLHGSWKWFPLGTFVANIAACVIDYIMKVLLARHHPLDSVSAAVLAGVVGGVGGCLSTVSTWVVEIQRLMLSFPKTSHGYQYIFISLGTAVALGLLVYGLPVWTTA